MINALSPAFEMTAFIAESSLKRVAPDKGDCYLDLTLWSFSLNLEKANMGGAATAVGALKAAGCALENVRRALDSIFIRFGFEINNFFVLFFFRLKFFLLRERCF